MINPETGVPATPAAPVKERARWLALGALVGPVLFQVWWILLAVALQPRKTSYGVIGGLSGAVTNPISGFGVGATGLPTNVIFVVSGLLTMVGLYGLFQLARVDGHAAGRVASAALLAASPLGLAVAGVFPLDRSVALHNLGAAMLFAVPVPAFLVAGLYLRHVPSWRQFGTWLILGSPLTLILLVVFAASYNQATITVGHGVAGLTERVMAVEIHAWYVAMGWLAFRRG